jgi:phosphate:Na+ symporter
MRVFRHALADRLRPDDPATPRHLDSDSIPSPTVVLVNAARETLRLADVVEVMLTGSHGLPAHDDRRLAVRLRQWMTWCLTVSMTPLKGFSSELAQTRVSE